MNIGIDIDDTINELAEILHKYGEIYNKENNISHNIDLSKWDFDELFGWNKEQEQDFFNRYIETLYKNAEIKENAKSVINKLKSEGHNIIIITARSKKHCKNPYRISQQWLEKKGVQFDKLITDSIDKAKSCKENDVDVFIDDHVFFCESVNSLGSTKVLMFDSPYNQEEKRFKRVSNWEEVYKEIKEMK